MNTENNRRWKRVSGWACIVLILGLPLWICSCVFTQSEPDEVVPEVENATPASPETPPPPPPPETTVPAPPAKPKPDVQLPRSYYGKVGKRLCGWMAKSHVSQRSFDDELSQRAWTNLVTFYDYDHSVFLQSDLAKLARRERHLDDELRAGDVSFGFDVYNLYVQRLRERICFATNLLAKGEWDFSQAETYRIKRKDAPWPTTNEEADDYWRRRMKNEVLVQRIGRELDAEEKQKKEKAAEKNCDTNAPAAAGAQASTNDSLKADTPEESLIKRYRQYVIFMTQPDEEAVLQHYLSAVCRSYDPHTDYMSPAVKDDFDMEMNLTLYGIGATLSMEDGALKIVEIMPGSPCERDGRLREGDKIVGVQQEGGPMEDVMWQPMRKSIKKIRGKKGTHVTLEIVPRSDANSKKRIELVRDEIKLEDQAATGRVETVSFGGVTNKLGYVFLPGFYGTMDKKPYEEGFRSCAMDVANYLADFNEQNAAGMILDLRGDGGGSLREAVLLSALFVSQGPVVQIRDVRTTGCLPIPPGNPIAFRKPMVVLTDRASASASEIVAGHLKDVGRAIVIGDRTTHGKGTVQSVTGLGPESYGSSKITTARFYRVNGRSTQLAGVEADIHLPSLLDSLDIGEDKLTYALPFSRIPPADYRPSWNMDKYVDDLRALSAKRLAGDERYAQHLANVRGMKEISEREEVSLEYAARKKMMAADRLLRELDDEEDESDDDETAAKKRRRKRNERDKNDVVLDEAFRILNDLVRMNDGAEVPQPTEWWL